MAFGLCSQIQPGWQFARLFHLFGGNTTDYGYAIAVDSSGSAYVTGLTTSPDFPITGGAYQTVCGPDPTDKAPPYVASCNSGVWSVFVTKLNPAGTGLVYSTFLGGYGWRTQPP